MERGVFSPIAAESYDTRELFTQQKLEAFGTCDCRRTIINSSSIGNFVIRQLFHLWHFLTDGNTHAKVV